MTIDQFFNLMVVVFTVSNLGAMGLELEIRESVRIFRNPRFVLLTLSWGWLIGPAIAWLIISIVPLQEAHAAGLMLISLAPTAPFFPMVARRARSDTPFAASFMLLTTMGTVVLLPLLAPLLVKGVTVSVMALAKPMLAMVLFPLLIGCVIRSVAGPVADKLFPVIKKIGGVSTLIVLVMTLAMYGEEMLGAVGSFAPGSQVLFFVLMATLAYRFGFGLPQRQRSGMALGMCTRNIAAVFAAYLGIVNPPDGLFVAIILVIPLTLIVALIAARIFSGAARADLTDDAV
jgi:bile acid:Na+ symporter, BASS family